MVAPIQKSNCGPAPPRNILLAFDPPTTEHPTHRGPAPPRNTLLTVDLPDRGTPYSLWTCPTAEHPTHCGPAPPRNTLLTVDLPHSETPYSPWTCPTAEHPTHRGPAPTPEQPTHSTEDDLQKILQGKGTDIRQTSHIRLGRFLF